MGVIEILSSEQFPMILKSPKQKRERFAIKDYFGGKKHSREKHQFTPTLELFDLGSIVSRS